jgi:O-antigen ligase
MIRERPVLGWGWGRFRTDSRDFYRQSPDYPLSFVRGLHNVYLTMAVELGLLGAELWLLAIAVVLFGAIFRRGPPSLRPWKLGLIAVAVSYGLTAISTPLAYAGPTLLLWTWAGVAWGATRWSSPTRGNVAQFRP